MVQAALGFARDHALASLLALNGLRIATALERRGPPDGVHFLGRHGDKATLFRLTSQLE